MNDTPDTNRSILVIHGPNLNMLGTREPGIYGLSTLDDINSSLKQAATKRQFVIEFYQSNYEGGIVDTIQSAGAKAGGIVINPGAFTHYSIAIRDAFSAVQTPTVEVHISNTAAREEFRHTSVISPVVVGSIAGLGVHGYHLALQYLMDRIDGEERTVHD